MVGECSSVVKVLFLRNETITSIKLSKATQQSKDGDAKSDSLPPPTTSAILSAIQTQGTI